MKRSILLAIALLFSLHIHAQGVRGQLTDEDGAPLPFATIYAEDLQTGTAANEEGNYQIRLPRGTHTLRFQYLGYHSETRTVRVENSFQTLDIQLRVQPIRLQEAIVSSDREDPAYTIMRKAIAKAKYHTQQIDSFDATVYIKGSGRLLKTPSLIFFKKKIENALKEEGIDSTTAFVTESVNEVHYERPGTFTQKVISVRTIGDDNNSSPNGFIQSSFYEPRVNTAISPLAPNAFAHYRFEYLGNFTDRGHLVNKIRVTPRSRGDQIFEGVIYIVDQTWAIHSLDLFTYIWGIKFKINQVYAPILENAWMPINQIYDVTGSVFGFKFEYRYLANVQDYDITLNPDLDLEVNVIDDKLEKELARQADKLLKEENVETLKDLESGKEVSRKQLRKLLKEYEKKEREELEEKVDTLADVEAITSFEVDSMAYKRDSVYWSAIRPLPLTKYEVRGYRKMDSIAVAAAKKEAEKDSVTVTMGSNGMSMQRVRNKSKFQPLDLLLGGSYKMGEHSRFAILGIPDQLHFNTVDGYNFKYLVRFSGKTPQEVDWSVTPGIRYAFSRKAVGFEMNNTFTWGERNKKSSFSIRGGRDISQLSRSQSIHPYINDFMSILFERNYMKVYEKDYLSAGWQKAFSRKLTVRINGEWEKRKPLMNNSDFVVFDSKRRTYTSNTPYNAEIGDTAFPEHNAFTTSVEIETRPWLKYRIRNNRRRVIENSSPTLVFRWNSGWQGLGGSDVSYQHLELGFKHDIRVGVADDMTFRILAGTFFSDDQMYFPDFMHFPGNKTPFATLDPVASYRMLDYYSFSTQSAYLSTFIHYQFRKFLITQFPFVRLTGMREGFYLNSLETKASDHYMELGYNLNYIFRFFRIEAVTSWRDFKFENFGIRIGIAANLDDIFN